MRNYLIRLLPQVMTPIRTKGLRLAHDLTYPLKRTGRTCPALCPGHVLLKRIPLGQPPSLRGLRRPTSDVVRPLPRYYGAVRLPMPVRHWIVSLDFPMRPSYPSDKGEHRISRFPCKVFPYAPRSPTARGPDMSRVNDMPGVAFRLTHIVSAPELICIAQLNTWLARTPVNASAMALLPLPHDSGPMWLATPSSYDSFIHYTLPVSRRFRVRLPRW